jgi:hypothetical protein
MLITAAVVDAFNITNERRIDMKLQEVVNHVRNEHKPSLAQQIAEKLVLLGAENIKYVKEGKYSFNYGMNVGQIKSLSWVLEQLKSMEGGQ